MLRITLLAGLLLIAAGCGESPAAQQSTARTTTVTEQNAIDIAREAVMDNDGWTDATYTAIPMGNGWQVTVERPGAKGERVIMIDAEGKVSVYEG